MCAQRFIFMASSSLSDLLDLACKANLAPGQTPGLFKKFYLGQNDPDLEIPCTAIQDQVIHLTFVLFFLKAALNWITLTFQDQ